MGSCIVPLAAIEAYTAAVLVAVGTPSDTAGVVARVLTDADAHGVDTHGVARLPAYVRLVDLGLLDVDARPQVLTSDGATAIVDAGNGFGQPAGELAADHACELATEYGIGWVSVRHSNHCGAVGYYTRRVAERGFVALGGTNSAAVVAPTRSTRRFLGTNPLAFAAPGSRGIAVDLDMSTSAVSGGKLESALREGRTVPHGWVLTSEGRPTTDPSEGLPTGGALLPLGGSELHGSYKGYGLALMIEVLSSALITGPYGPRVGPLTSAAPTGAADVSHFIFAIDPSRFGDQERFAQHLDGLCAELRSLPHTTPDSPVLVPGDPERLFRSQYRSAIPLHSSVLATLDELAARLGVAAPTRFAHDDSAPVYGDPHPEPAP